MSGHERVHVIQSVNCVTIFEKRFASRNILIHVWDGIYFKGEEHLLGIGAYHFQLTFYVGF